MPSLEEALLQYHFPNEQVKANLNVLYTAHCLYNRVSAILKPFGVTNEQYNVLRILRGKHPEAMCQKDILRRMIAPTSNVTLLIKKLGNKQLISLQQSDRDKREYQIHITAQGLDLLKNIDTTFQENRDTLQKLSTSEAFHLNALLDKLRE
mgnify:CR=1 FL=1